MKNILKSFLLLAIFASVGCEKDFNEVNIDPNTSPTAKDAQVLTSAIGYMSYIVDVDLNKVGPAIFWCEFFKVDSCRYANRECQRDSYN